MSISLRKRKPERRLRSANDKLLDATGWKLLHALQADARLSSHKLGAAVGLSAPAAAERVRRMEQAGLIAGYRAVVPLAGVGLPLLAFVRVFGMNHDRYYDRMLATVRAMPRVLEAPALPSASPWSRRCSTASPSPGRRFHQEVAVGGREIEPVDFLQPLDLRQRSLAAKVVVNRFGLPGRARDRS